MLYPYLHYYENESDAHNSGNHNVLKSLPLYKYYEELHKAVDIYKDRQLDDHCKYCSSNQGNQSEEGSNLIKLCRGICGTIQNFDNIKQKCKKISDEKWCPYINYWLFDYALNTTNSNGYVNSFYFALTIISGSGKNLLKNCSFQNYNLDKSTFDTKKILYEFTEIYDHIKEEISGEYNLKIQSYCKHIKENFRFYNDVKIICPDSTCKYHTELQEFKKKFSESDELEFICEKCKYQKTSCKQGTNAEGDVPCLRIKGNPFLSLIYGDDPEHIINVLLNFSLISTPILALFVILFKFTPLGKSLNKLKQERKKSGRKKKEENIQDYMKNYAAYLDSEMKNRVHLGYHAT
ncbi:PIR protein [Plasmodium vivax]|uniref:VIR protein n=1 Tax=Plasmodium vivax TaxID=5855 RepID=A0A565A4B6_PLAVI|nr:PIR protein [Plasmodium vivax]